MNGSEVLDVIKNVVVSLAGAINSNFFSAAFGALAGAVGAGVIASRTESRKELLAEIRNSGKAILFAAGIAEIYLTVKSQNVVPLMDNYDAHRASHKAALSENKPGAVFVLHMDLRSLETPHTPIQNLRTLAFDSLSSQRSISLVNVLSLSIEGSITTITSRNLMLNHFKLLSDAERTALYFGHSIEGNTDTSYVDFMEAFPRQVDDVIYFSLALIRVLRAYGERMRLRVGKGAPTLPLVDFNKPFANGLFPDRSNYPDYENQLKLWRKSDEKDGFAWAADVVANP